MKITNKILNNFELTEQTEFNIKDYKNPVPRKLMSKEEIKWAENLVKIGKMIKGTSDDKQKSVIYYANDDELNEGVKSLKKSDIKIILDFEGSSGRSKEIIEPEELSNDIILSLTEKYFSKKLENFNIKGKPYVGTNGDYVGVFIECNWKGDSEAKANVEVRIRLDKMFDKIIDSLS